MSLLWNLLCPISGQDALCFAIFSALPTNLYRLSDHYEFKKPNDRRALDLMNAAAAAVMKDLPDLCIAYGVSDEFRYASLWHLLSTTVNTL